MYAVISIVQWLDGHDPFCSKVRSVENIEVAVETANAMNKELLDKYGKDYYEDATTKNCRALGTNGETSWFVYIKEFS